MTRTAMLVWIRIACVLIASGWIAQALAEPKQVLILYDERATLPGLAAFDASLARELEAGGPSTVELYRETLDLSRFGSKTHSLQLQAYLRAKYATKNIDAAVAVMAPSLDFLLDHEILPAGTPIVFAGIDRRGLRQLRLPSNVTGVLLNRRFAPTLDLALRLHPGTERIVFVAGHSSFDLELLGQARSELKAFENRVAFDYLTALPLPELLTQLAALPPRTLILYSTLFQDGAGNAHVPHEAVEAIAAAANRPVYSFVDQYLGRGIVGGSLYSLDTQGEHVARLVLQILAGAQPSSLPLVEVDSTKMLFDWRQLQRWGIRESDLPAGAVVRFQGRSLWNDYRPQVIVAMGLVLLQAIMIASLLLQRQRRRRAEIAAERLRIELAHATRLATTGQLIAAIAHEVNQPLASILANVSAAELLLKANDQNLDSIREILSDVRQDDLRASEVVRRLRSLLAKHEMTIESLDLNDAVQDVVRLLEPELRRRRVALETLLDPSLPMLQGDRVHLQQVVLNLVVNAMDAMADTPIERRRVLVKTAQHDDGSVEVAVVDHGHGIAPERRARLFESFYTTKPHGMGLGLSIAHSIVEAHAGRIWAESNGAEGATFRFSLPSTRSAKSARLPAARIEAA